MSETNFNNAQSIDFALCQRAGQGDIAAYDELYTKYKARVYSLCLRMLKNTHEAEDLAQEVWIQFFRKSQSFRGDSAFATWLHRITINAVLMHFRKRIVKHETTTEEGEFPPQVISGTGNTTKMPIIDKIAIDTAIAELPRGYRDVFVLCDIEGYQHDEVARILKCSIGTSKSQLHKARLKLRKLLDKKNNLRLTKAEMEKVWGIRSNS